MAYSKELEQNFKEMQGFDKPLLNWGIKSAVLTVDVLLAK